MKLTKFFFGSIIVLYRFLPILFTDYIFSIYLKFIYPCICFLKEYNIRKLYILPYTQNIIYNLIILKCWISCTIDITAIIFQFRIIKIPGSIWTKKEDKPENERIISLEVSALIKSELNYLKCINLLGLSLIIITDSFYRKLTKFQALRNGII